MMIKIINFIKNLFRKNEDKIFKVQGKSKRIGTKKQFADKGNRQIFICKNCAKEFILTDSEKSFYNRNGLPLPKRCPDCRRIRRLKNSKDEIK